nr:MAG: minor capsid protein 2 [Bacteriophage sp.]
MAKRQKTTRFSIQGWDARHYRTTDAYVQAVQSLYDKATMAITRAAARGKIDPDKPFSFDMYPSVKKEMQRITEQLASRVTTVIESGSKKQWLFACAKNDGFISSIMDTSKLSKARLKKMQDRNLDALSAFQSRKVEGMNLSQRVWKYVDQYKAQMESALDVGLGEGRSADELSRDVRQNLREPNRLFRRVRDKRGNLVLSKNARAYHPGQGVYRSSYKNAMRLTRSEINMAYRESDYQRWQQLDFVVGFEIHRSNHEPLCKCDICSKLVGRYPKTFKFKGWHPQCMCYATPILMDEETFDANELGDLKAALRGTTYKHQQAKNAVSDVPDGFKAWAKDHVEAQKGWASTPYFIKDNFVDGQLGKGLKIAMPTTTPAGKVDFHVPFDKLSVGEQLKFESEMANRHDDDWELLHACGLYGIDVAWYNTMCKDVYRKKEYWRVAELNAARDRLKAQVMAKIAEAKAKALQAINDYENAIKDAGEWIGDMSYKVVNARDMMKDEASEPYPNYISLLNSANGGSLDASRIRSAIDKAKADYAQTITDANSCVAKYGGTVDVAKLKALLAEKRTTARNALVITKDIQNEIKNVQQRYDDAQKGFCSTNIDECQANKIEHREVKKHQKEVSMDDIITRIGGGDRTKGSCASLGLAYAANRGGYDVLDFRDGESRTYFASHPHLSSFIGKMGGITNMGRGKMSGIELMRTTEIGKEYYLAIACHAAIVRQVSKGKYEYLELQSAISNGWKPLNAKVFGWRFGANGREWYYEMIEISKLYNDPSFIKLMGYINTAEDKQVKGKYGTIK